VNSEVSRAPSEPRAPLDSARSEVLAELQAMRADITHIEGSIVATTDGLVIAHDLGHSETYGVEPEGVAALSAVNLGLSQRIADTASHGHLRETVVRGSFGQVVTYPAGGRALLTVLVRAGVDIDGLHIHARRVADRVADLLTDSWQDDAATWHSPA
jgi:predicted regulator of Ras-like GTPase activity (Roadblock/LC7/MglB family)